MANWATVENNQITGYYDLIPPIWKHVSGLDKSVDDLEFLKSIGWFPVVRQEPEPYDVNLYEMGSFRYEIEEDRVLEIPVITARAEPLVPSAQILKDNFMDHLRFNRNKLLSQSDFTQLADMQSVLAESVKYSLMTYRQALRDLPQLYSAPDILDVSVIVWPAVPSLEPEPTPVPIIVEETPSVESTPAEETPPADTVPVDETPPAESMPVDEPSTGV